jgi:hypothetical protein
MKDAQGHGSNKRGSMGKLDMGAMTPGMQRILGTAHQAGINQIGNPDHLNEALSHPDVAWGFHRMATANDIALMDRLLVERQHPLASQPGTPENRFRSLHKSGFRF